MRTTAVAVAALLLLVSSYIATADEFGGHSRPESVTATCGSATADIAWSAVTDPHLSGYDVYRRHLGDADFVKANGATITGTSFTDTGLAVLTTYDYGVQAVFNDGHTSSMSDTARCTTV